MRRARAWLAPLLVILTVVAIYGPLVRRAQYAQDDLPAILHHAAVKWPVNLYDVVHARYFGDEEHDYDPLARPLVTLSYALEIGLGADSSAARHTSNLLLYAVVCAWMAALAYRLAAMWRLGNAALWTALASGLWFALHPAHAEVVMQVAYRPELLASLFALASFEVLLALRRGGRWQLWLLPGALTFAAALWSKEQSFMLLPIACLWALARPALLRRFLPLLFAWALVAAAWLAWRHWLLGSLDKVPVSEAINPLVAVAPLVRIWSALAIVLRAAQHLVWPVDLAPDYGLNAWPPVLHPDAEVLGGALLLVGLLAAAVICWRRARQIGAATEHDLAPAELALLALVWAVLTWLPVSNLLFPSTTLFGDRLLFAPSEALCLGVPLAVALWLPSWQPVQRRLRMPVLAAVVGVTAVVCLRETPAIAAAWADESAIYTRGVALQPQSMRMLHNLAYTLAARGQLAEARILQQRALRIRPTDLDVLALGLELARKEKRCGDGVPLARTLATIAKPAVQARQIALNWAMACQQWREGWAAARLIPPQRLPGRVALDVFALGVAAAENRQASIWAAAVEKTPWQSPAWVAAGVFGAEAGGRPLEALQHLVDLHRAQPQLPELDTAAHDLYQRHRDHDDAPAMQALLRVTWPNEE